MSKRPTPLKAIRLKCLDCCNGQYQEVRECSIKGCPCWLYRLGHYPKEDLSILDSES
jgi:hypothetical protein